MTAIKRLAIVNRGECAMRALTAVAELNLEHSGQAQGERITSIAVYTDPDAEAPFVLEADEGISLGSSTFLDPADGHRKSRYLDEAGVVEALVAANVDAVWVGWGFVAERASFAQRCEEAGICFVGPDSETIRLLGDKVTAKRLAEKADVPVVPWSGGPVDDVGHAHEEAEVLGYPVVIKATAGGGGRGIRVVGHPSELAALFTSARTEAELAFGDPAVFLEEFVSSARHVEVQILADNYGTVWAVGVRDCSVQRRNQKVIEESSSTVLDAQTEAEIKAAAVRLATTAGYRNAGTVEFLVDPLTRQFLFMEVNTRLQVEHAVTELTTGLDLVKLQLHIAAGGRLEGTPPEVRGHAVEARLCAEEPEHGFVPSPGRIALLRLPAGSGVRVDSGVREGDTIAADFDSMIAKIIAWGETRAEAFSRLRRALLQTAVVLTPGSTNRSFLLTLLEQPDVLEGRADNRWLDRFTADNGHVPPPDRVALLVAAIESYDADHAAAQASFHVAARRGRPEMPSEIGTRVRLRYRSLTYQLHVFRTSPGTYRVQYGDQAADVALERLDEYERRVVCGGRTHQVLAVAHSAGFRVLVDGTAHQVMRDDGNVVRAGWPAFVVSVLVQPGDQVLQNAPLVVLESMKMESTTVAPFAGEVASVEVVPNAQVDAGAPLVRLRSPQADSVTPITDVEAVDLTGLEAKPASGTPPCERVYGAIRNYLLGYDIDAKSWSRLLVEQRRLGEIARADDPGLLACEDGLLDLFAEVAALSRPRTDTSADGDLTKSSSQEYLLAFLQWLDVDRAGLPAAFVERLQGALTRYGVKSLEGTPELQAAVVWMFRSFARVGTLIPVIVSVLERRLRAGSALALVSGEEMRNRLDRLTAACQDRHQAVAELARDVRFHYFDEPVLESLVEKAYEETERAFDQLAEDSDGPDRAARMDVLVNCPQPLRGHLLRHWRTSTDGDFHRVLLEAYARRYYRTRELHDIRVSMQSGHLLGAAEYDYGNKHIHLVVSYTGFEQLPSLFESIAAHLRDQDPRRDIVVDVTTWRVGERPDSDELSEEIRVLLGKTAFARQPWRVDITMTSTTGPAPEHSRTQHLTYRPREDGGYAEELLYRNLHPMLGKRLDLWRFANFSLERLNSAEDVYLFHGVAHENPKDHRLFALAEVRDLTVVLDAAGAATYPWLGRMGLECLAAMRQALAAYPPRERPLANRIVLYVRPPWNVPRETWPALAQSFAPLAKGVGLEKVILRVRIPDENGDLHDSVLHVEGVGSEGVRVRELPPGDEPVRPLTAYQHNVLLAARFGAPYPYEIVKLLAAEAGTSADFPPGRFVELDLGPGGTLVPVDREPGRNVAHVVVGLLTSYPPKVPEGMTRVAVLSDPTRGLGNLAEPECSRIMAALDLAEQMHLPMEWFAVSSGALIAMDSGTENMDWIAAVLRRLIEYTQAGGEVNIIVTGINVGGQPYWNAEATMLMHTKGILIMTTASAMVLTGKQALDFSGGVSAEDNFGIGGYDRVMGPNGQAQYWAPTFEEACKVLLRHYDHTYVVPGERFPRREKSSDPVSRDVCNSPHTPIPGSDFTVVGDVFSELKNAERKSPFDIRSVMRAVSDTEAHPLERWGGWRGAETSVVWDTHVGGIPVCMLGLESRALARRGFVPADGPISFTSGTLFPQASRKTARAINAASNNRPLVVLANLSGFDGSPESMRRWQLEYGAEIGRAVTNFDGPIVFVVVSRYHGGAFVVFSKKLNESMEIAAVEGSYASVIGGAPAAATVFAREVKTRTEKDPRVADLVTEMAAASSGEAAALRSKLARVREQVRSEKLGQVAGEFDEIHTIQRALTVGSVDRIIAASELRPYVIDALERGMSRTLAARS